MNPIRTVAVGFDGSPDAEDALGWAMGLAGQVGADVAAVHATGLLEHASGVSAVDELEQKVGALAARSGFDPGRLRWYSFDGDPCSVLLRVRDQPVDADVLVVGSRGAGAHTGTLLGSTSHELAERAACPVVIVPTFRAV